MNKREITALEKAFDIPEPLHKKEFAAKFRELEKNNKKRSFISPRFMKLASTTVMCALIIGVWANIDENVQPDQYREDSVSAVIVTETDDDNDKKDDTAEETETTTIAEKTTSAITSSTTSEAKEKNIKKGTTTTSAKTSVTGTKTTSAKSENKAAETTKNESDNSEKQTTVSSEQKTSENKITSTVKTTEKTTSRTTSKTTDKETTTRPTTKATTTTSILTTKATTTKSASITTTAYKNNEQNSNQNTEPKSDDPVVSGDKGENDKGFSGNGGSAATPRPKDMTVDAGTRYYPNGNYVSQHKLLTGEELPDYAPVAGGGNNWAAQKVSIFDNSDTVVMGNVYDVIYTVIDDIYYVQVNLEVQQCYKGFLNQGDRISIFYEGGYMYATEFVRKYGYNIDASEGVMVDVNSWGTYRPDEGDTYLFYLFDSHRYIDGETYMITRTEEQSIFKTNGYDCFDIRNNYAFNINEIEKQ